MRPRSLALGLVGGVPGPNSTSVPYGAWSVITAATPSGLAFGVGCPAANVKLVRRTGEPAGVPARWAVTSYTSTRDWLDARDRQSLMTDATEKPAPVGIELNCEITWFTRLLTSVMSAVV